MVQHHSVNCGNGLIINSFSPGETFFISKRPTEQQYSDADFP